MPDYRRQNLSAAQIRNLLAGGVDTLAGPAPPTVGPFAIQTADTWTSDGAGGFYWDLVHGLGRALIVFQVYDSVANEYNFRIKSAKPLTGSETTTLRITLTFPADDDRLQIGYL